MPRPNMCARSPPLPFFCLPALFPLLQREAPNQGSGFLCVTICTTVARVDSGRIALLSSTSTDAIRQTGGCRNLIPHQGRWMGFQVRHDLVCAFISHDHFFWMAWRPQAGQTDGGTVFWMKGFSIDQSRGGLWRSILHKRQKDLFM